MLKAIFSDILNTELKTINNSIIELGDIDDSGKGRHFKSRFIKDGLVKIEGHGIVLIKKETLDSSLSSMIGTPVIIKHQKVTDENADELRVGIISDAYFNEPDGWYYCEGIIWDKKAQKLIEQKGWSVSCSYDFLAYNDEGGEENNIKYDKEFTKLNFVHLALVNNPRYERANIVFNCKVDNDRWITIKPHGDESDDYRRLKLEDGETPKEAIDRTYGKKDNVSKDYKENTSHYGKKEHQEEIISLYEGLKNPDKSEARKKEDRELLEHHLKELNKYSDTSDIHLSDEETKRENKIKEIKKELNKKQSDTKEKKKERTFIDKKTGKEQSLKDLVEKGLTPVRYSSSLWENKPSYGIGDGKIEYKITEEEYKQALEHQKDKKSTDLKKAKEQSKDLTDYIKWQYNADIEPHITRRIGDKTLVEWDKLPRETQSALKRLDFDDKVNLEQYSSYEMSINVKDKKIFENLEKHRQHISEQKQSDTTDKQSDSKGENEKYRSRFPDIQNLIGTLSKDDKYFDSKYRTAEKRLNEKLKFAKKELKERDFADMPSVKKSKEQIVKTIEEEIEKLKLMKDKNKQLRLFNNKEQEMALIEELKKLIKRVENNKEQENMDIENGKVDKRKLIDEVAGIMKSAGCDDEDIRTAIGKMEKIGYDKSEDDTADNCGGKKVKNEEKSEEVKNEEKEEPEKDKKEVEEVKEEIKEDVGNKCDNSKSSFDKINGIYNSIKQVAQGRQFVSRQDKLDNAVEYFK